MNNERDTMGIVRSWLRDDGYDNGDRVLDAVLAGIDGVPQRRSRPLGFRWPSLNARTLRYAVAAASIVAAAIFGLDWLSRSVANPPTPAPTATPSASTLVRLPEEELHGGRYGLALALGISVEVPPAGWGGCCLASIIVSDEGPQDGALVYSDVTHITIYRDPCHWSTSKTLQPSGAEAIATALSALPGRNGTEPERVTLPGGATAVHVRLTVPKRLAASDTGFEDCYGHEYRTWNSLTGDPVRQWGPEQVDDIYLVDVKTSTVAFDLVHYPETSQASRRALQEMLASIRID